MKKDKKVILKVLVGSRAHNLHDKDSDYDYRSVYILPTSDILSLGYKYKGSSWTEGDKHDNTAYEIGHFLELATKCNPTILEMFKAPIIEATEEGKKLRELFPYIWNPKQAFDAFVGYGLNQRKKFLDKKDNRQNKYAVAYIRTLFNLIQLLETGTFDVEIKQEHLKECLLNYKKGKYSSGEIINQAEYFTQLARASLEDCKHKPNSAKVKEFILKIRKENW